MQKKTIKAVAISPIFSHGASTNNAELRPSEFKALMRNVFRWAVLERDAEKLYKMESEYFGGSNEGSHASPIHLQFTNLSLIDKAASLVHRKVKKNVSTQCCDTGTTFDIVLRKYLQKGQSIAWYEEMLKLSSVLSGVGKRNRRGRGVITLDGLSETKDELLNWIVGKLNALNGNQVFEREQDIIHNTSSLVRFKRPVIEKVVIGQQLISIPDFLMCVDQVSHDIKKNYKRDKGQFLTGFANGGERLASSIVISIVQTGNGKVHPVYTYLHPVFKGKVMCVKNDDRVQFVEKLKQSKGEYC